MLKRLSPREQIGILLDQYSAAIRDTFLLAVSDIRSKITLAVIVDRLEKHDIQGAIEALNIERSAFNPVLDQIATAYNAGGNAAVEGMPALRDPDGHRLIIRFDVRNLRAEAWLRQHSADLVTNIMADQRQAIQTAFSEGLSVGANPRQTALNVVGRINRVTGRRDGGVIGITSQQAQFVATARQELLSGDPVQLRNYLGRVRRDKRFDAVVRKAVEDAKPLNAETVARITGRYSDSLLQLRGEMIGRTETMTALNVAKDEAMQQAIDGGKVAAATVTSIWHSAHDDRVRHTHQVLDGETVPFGGTFHSPSGAMLRFPGDPRAPTAEIVGCRCWLEHKIDFLAGLR
jgi:hypothetical protein